MYLLRNLITGIIFFRRKENVHNWTLFSVITMSSTSKVYEKSRGNHSTNTEYEIVDLRKKLKNVINANTTFCSFELTHAKNTDFYQSFFAEMNKYRPLFYALTCHMDNETKDYSSLDIFKIFPSNTLLHLLACHLTSTDVKTILTKALNSGIINIFVLKGDSTNTNVDFPYAVDLVRFIRKEFGNKFCICVAGYPQIHPESLSKEMDLYYLKEKVDAGADFIITQIFFESNIFIKFVEDCKKVGINIPIIPGIFPIPNYKYFEKMIKICNVKVPQIIFDTLKDIKEDDDKVRNYGLELSINMIKEIIASKTTCGFHFFTFNRTLLSSEICNRLNIFH